MKQVTYHVYQWLKLKSVPDFISCIAFDGNYYIGVRIDNCETSFEGALHSYDWLEYTFAECVEAHLYNLKPKLLTLDEWRNQHVN